MEKIYPIDLKVNLDYDFIGRNVLHKMKDFDMSFLESVKYIIHYSLVNEEYDDDIINQIENTVIEDFIDWFLIKLVENYVEE